LKVREYASLGTEACLSHRNKARQLRRCARNVQQASGGTADVARNISGVREAVESSTAATTQVLAAARDLSRQSEALRGEMHKFLTTVRAA
jgi:methyl-accepting chemotaxis protein